MAFSMANIPPMSSIFAAYASVSTFIMLIQTMLHQLVPRQVQHYVLDLIRRYFTTPCTNNATVVIDERDGMSNNEVYVAAETYLCSQIRPDILRLKISKRFEDTALTVRFAQSEKMVDSHDGVDLEWSFVNVERKKASKIFDADTDNMLVDSRRKYFELSFDKKFREHVVNKYLPSILERAQLIRDEKKLVKLHTLSCAASYASFVWDSINLEHPSTFQTLAMDPALKKRIIEDLDRFVTRKDYYRKVGRAWKRGYLLYGPPGTGKSSLIAAMANYLKFDIYDLELTNVKRDSDLRKVLLRTANRSILVIEDIDCSVELPDRKTAASATSAAQISDEHFRRPRDHQFTLAGLLNFIDGLWSSCGDERIIIFTTNNKSKLDPALLRPGRMDMHIHMSYLTPDGFNLLASTYLDVHGHNPRLLEIGDLLKGKNVTPAEVAEELMKCDDVDSSLDGVVNFLKNKTNNNIDDAETVEEEGIEVDKAKDEDEDEDIKAKQVVG